MSMRVSALPATADPNTPFPITRDPYKIGAGYSDHCPVSRIPMTSGPVSWNPFCSDGRRLGVDYPCLTCPDIRPISRRRRD